MATLGLGIAGKVAGAALGPFGSLAFGALGSLIGSYIDQAFLAPYLFPKSSPVPPRVDEMQVSHQDEGAPANFIVAGTARVEGTVIWQTDVEEVAIESDEPGKGGGEKQIVGYSYFYTAAVAVTIGQLASIDEILIEGNKLYDSTPDVNVTSSVLSVQVIASGNSTKMRINSAAGGPDLSQLVSGKDVVVSGFANGANNGTFRCKGSARDKSAGTSYVVLRNTSAVTEAAGASVTLFQDLPTFNPAHAASITIYLGTGSQSPDPIIEAVEGTGNVAGYRGTAYVVFEDLLLEPYGNRAPQIYNFAGTAPGAATAAVAIQALNARAGRASNEVDVSALTASVGGYSISGPVPMGQAMQPILLAKDILTQEGADSIRFFHRQDATIIDIPESDLGAVEFGGAAAFPIEIDDAAETRVPAEVIVDYIDSENAYQSGSQRERQGSFTVDDVLTVKVPIAMTGAEARQMSRRIRALAHNYRKVKVSLPPTYGFAQENDCFRFRALGSQWLVLINRADEGANYLLQFECTVEQRDALQQVAEADAPYDAENFTTLPGDVDADAVEIPPMGTEGNVDIGAPHVTISAAKEDPHELWGGVQLFGSEDDVEFVPWHTLTKETKRGSAITVLGGTGITPTCWDRASTVDVIIARGSLESRTEAEVLGGANRAIIGDEIIGFATATLIGPSQYRLSTLLRGTRDTADAMTTHVAGERFVFLNGGGAKQVPFNPSMIGTTRYLRFVPGGGSVDNYPSQEIELTGAFLRPFAGTAPVIMRDDTGNVALTWQRRTRAIVRTFAPAQVPVAERLEQYEVEVRSADGVVLYRTIPATTPTIAYTTDQISADGLSPFDAVMFRIYQLSEVVGRGKKLEVVG